MKRYLAIPLALLFTLLLALPATAAMTQFEKFYVDVPEGWIVSPQDDGVSLISPDGKCAAGIAIKALKSGSANDSQTFAAQMSRQMKGDAPQKVPGTSAYVFMATVDGLQAETVVYVNDGMVLLFTITGDGEPYIPELNRISSSMNSADPVYSKMFK